MHDGPHGPVRVGEEREERFSPLDFLFRILSHPEESQSSDGFRLVGAFSNELSWHSQSVPRTYSFNRIRFPTKCFNKLNLFRRYVFHSFGSDIFSALPISIELV